MNETILWLIVFLQFGDILVSIGLVAGVLKYTKKHGEGTRLIGLVLAMLLLLAAIYL
jgi:di/tricarboxylate transporter